MVNIVFERVYCIVLKQYSIIITTSALLANLIVLAYFFYEKEPDSNHFIRSSTEFSQNTVPGPIQPIPEIVSIDLEWARLGKALFNSTLLSKDNSISCASCHVLNFGGADSFPVSVGVGDLTGNRNSPTVINAVFNFRQFWDGRSRDLSEQVAGPIHNPLEMASGWPQIIKKLTADETFNAAFKTIDENGITVENIILAIATFQESLITPGSPIDRYLLGESGALTDQQKRGWEKFNSFGCIACHQGRNIGGNFFQRIGRVDQIPAILSDDLGRYNVTFEDSDRHVFKVPSLRNITKTAPYFHNGSVSDLRDAIKIMAQMQLGLVLTSEDIDDILTLLESFSSDLAKIEG